jgi:Trypsin-like peptidase domain
MKALGLGRWMRFALTVAVVGQAVSTSKAQQDPSQPPSEAVQTIVMIGGEFANGPTAGAGLVFGGDRKRMYVLTADHVVRRRSGEVAKNLTIKFRSRQGSSLPAVFTGHADQTLDIAVLEVQGLEEHGVSFCDQPFGWFTASRTFRIQWAKDARRFDVLRKGAAVYPVGHPNGRGWMVPAVADRIVEASEELIVFQSSIISEGHSGGALLTEHGDIVGLIQAHEPPFGRARPIPALFDTLRSWGYRVAAHWPEGFIARLETAISTSCALC